ncbi:TolC family protein [Shewanella frigidimarina]|uniref:RND efflux system, outer membrane lipoprotein, NodT family protein n=1 Tax=Shewanella frigidimarina (strain NCIMB 400) TaxID=318167 RepID=Q07WV8_SHEFN|nr:TolC family protein [Shewanella frigidimarina]ABI73506.1 RND efflux system, outer membrane lipoprotein, NodT family protein [Shewanella frigidimarina NCIMB 400]
MMVKPARRHAMLALIVVSLLGCSTVDNSNYIDQASQAQAKTSQQLIEQLLATKNTQGVPSQSLARLTDLINVPELQTFISAALQNNPSLQQSVVALNMAYAQHGITSASRLPSVDASFSGTSTEDSDDSYTTDITVSWELDLWQKIADSSNAALKDIASTQASLQSAQDLVVANVMRSWLDISLKQQLVAIETQRLAVLDNNQALILARYRVGLGSLEDLDNATTSVASTQATLVDYQEQLAQSRRNLTLLTGQWTGSDVSVDISAQFPTVLNPIDSLGQQNLGRRPDIKTAFYNIEAESLRTDAAYKAMLPSISLSASLSDMAQSPSDALLTGPLWSVLGQLSAPLFQGGKLTSQAELARLTTQQRYWVYQETLLNAVNEVENSVGQEYSLAKQQQHLTDAQLSAQRSFVSYEQKYRQGLVDIFDLLTVQQQTFDVEAQLVTTIYNRLINRIDLGLALGLGVSHEA